MRANSCFGFTAGVLPVLRAPAALEEGMLSDELEALSEPELELGESGPQVRSSTRLNAVLSGRSSAVGS